MRFVDNTDPKDEKKLSKCSEPDCKYVGSIMRESEDGKRWCAIHGEGKPDSEPTYCKHINNGKEIHLPVVDGECPECRARAVQRVQPDPVPSTSVEPQVEPSRDYVALDCISCRTRHPVDALRCMKCGCMSFDKVAADSVSHPPLEQVAAPSGESLEDKKHDRNLLYLYSQFRAAWIRQGDCMNPDDVKAEHERMVTISDKISELARAAFCRERERERRA